MMQRIVASTKSRIIVHRMVEAVAVVMSLEPHLLPILLSEELRALLV
jgi:hypothetical protein